MPAAGATIGAYRILHALGEGGMGTVYLGEHALLGRRAAIKVLRPGLSKEEDTVQRFFNEARAVTRIADPGIVQVFDFGYHTDGNAFIVMELLEGEPLDERIARVGLLGARDCVRLVRMLCASLEVVHAKGVVHRDLKPENIFLVADPAVPGGERAKILDFGIAKLSGGEPGTFKTLTGVLLGTPVYMSPEQCRGANRGDGVDHRADIYSIACVMFTMLTGRPPFQGEAGELIAAHLREPPPFASSLVPALPPAIDEVLQRALRKAPGERFQSMAELIAAIDLATQALDRPSAEVISVERSGALAAAPEAPWPRAARVESRAPLTPTDAHRTTLTGATGQLRSGTLAERPRRRWRSAVVAVAVAAGGWVGFVAARGGGTPGAGARAPVHDSRAAAMTAPPDLPGDVAPSGPAAAAVPGDAGVADASPVAAMRDAAAPWHRPAKPTAQEPRPPSKGFEHATTRRSVPRPSENDRGD